MDYKPVIIDALTTLEMSDTARGETFSARAYNKVLSQLKAVPVIRSVKDVEGVDGIGAKMKAKFKEIFETGKLASAENAKANPEFTAFRDLLNVYGVGPVKARQFIDKGIRGIKDMRELVAKDASALTAAQKLGLRYYEDTLERIPRAEIDEHRAVLQKAFTAVGLTMEIVGSYRRGAANSGDIDVLITGPKSLGKSKMSAAFKTAVDGLEAGGYLLGILARGPTKTLAYSAVPSVGKGRRLDLLLTDPVEYPYAILYFTGSDLFNIAMRRWALEQGYTMNEHGMTPIKDAGPAPPMSCERDIFDYLGLTWVPPTERRDSGQVVAAAATQPTEEEMLEALRAARRATKLV
jgi:DNA polymerase/3'-5' exonuclease PolX